MKSEPATSFARDRSGNVAILFGLMCVPMLMFIGGAVDIGRWVHARTQTASALDAAVLAGGQLFRIDRNEGAAQLAMKRFYEENTLTRLELKTDLPTFQFRDNYKEIVGRAQGSIETPFLAFANVPSLPIDATATAVLDAGGEGSSNIEVSMMLDITGSMAGSKITDLKDAAKDLVNIVIWEDQSEYTAKVALAPFSAGVNVGSMINSVSVNPSASTISFKLNNSTTKAWKKSPCVAERTGLLTKYSDAAPSVDKLQRIYTSDGKCETTNEIVPLSSDRSKLTSAIDSYKAAGVTAGHLGTAWAWYLLSPNWASVFPAESAPAPYSDLVSTIVGGNPKVKKIALLMTDGEFNMQYCNSSTPTTTGVAIPDKNSNPGNDKKGNCTASNGNATTQARSLCSGMKLAGIEVYAVGFQLGGTSSSAYQTLSQCATDADHFYNTSDGAELKQAFRDIAIKISPLRLSN